MTKCYTYEVKMVIQILAEDEDAAKTTLDDKGGYVTKRDVKLLASTELKTTDDEFIEIIHSMDTDK
jgi:hypothetical protein